LGVDASSAPRKKFDDCLKEDEVLVEMGLEAVEEGVDKL